MFVVFLSILYPCKYLIVVYLYTKTYMSQEILSLSKGRSSTLTVLLVRELKLYFAKHERHTFDQSDAWSVKPDLCYAGLSWCNPEPGCKYLSAKTTLRCDLSNYCKSKENQVKKALNV